jgi:hypothetical protein
MQTVSLPDALAIERITGFKGKQGNSEYKITVPQNDLSTQVDAFKIIPASDPAKGNWLFSVCK